MSVTITDTDNSISIHAPLRERLFQITNRLHILLFQSTLPCGSDVRLRQIPSGLLDFNPRSLAGATVWQFRAACSVHISIHAPLRERRISPVNLSIIQEISIHAPLRERLLTTTRCTPLSVFQSTLPCGSDFAQRMHLQTEAVISIHAPLRERRKT